MAKKYYDVERVVRMGARFGMSHRYVEENFKIEEVSGKPMISRADFRSARDSIRDKRRKSRLAIDGRQPVVVASPGIFFREGAEGYPVPNPNAPEFVTALRGRGIAFVEFGFASTDTTVERYAQWDIDIDGAYMCREGGRRRGFADTGTYKGIGSVLEIDALQKLTYLTGFITDAKAASSDGFPSIMVCDRGTPVNNIYLFEWGRMNVQDAVAFLESIRESVARRLD